MRDFICGALPWLALVFALLGMRDLDSAVPTSLVAVILLFWAVNWLVHHIPLRWLRYLRNLLWVLIIVAIIVVPELRTAFEGFVENVITLQPSTLIVLSLVTLIIWGVMCLARPAQQTHS